MVSDQDLRELETSINKDFAEARLPATIEIRDFKQTPVLSLEHNLHYSKTVSLGAHIRVWEIVGERFDEWLRKLGLTGH